MIPLTNIQIKQVLQDAIHYMEIQGDVSAFMCIEIQRALNKIDCSLSVWSIKEFTRAKYHRFVKKQYPSLTVYLSDGFTWITYKNSTLTPMINQSKIGFLKSILKNYE